MKDKSPVFEYALTIRESHIDTLGHINNATYLEIFEDARWDLITANGYGLKEVHEKKKSPIILEINIKFLKEVKNREKVIVKSFAYDYSGKIGKINQTMVKENGEEACVAIITFAFFDIVTRRIIPATPEWQKAVGLTD